MPRSNAFCLELVAASVRLCTPCSNCVPITAPQSAPGGCLFKAHCAICVHAQKAGPLLEIGSTGVALLHAEVTSVCNGACLFTCAVAPRGFFMMHVFIVKRVLVACPGRMQGKAMRANVFRRLSFVEESLLEYLGGSPL